MKAVCEIEVGKFFVYGEQLYQVLPEVSPEPGYVLVQSRMFELLGEWHHYSAVWTERFTVMAVVQPVRITVEKVD